MSAILATILSDLNDYFNSLTKLFLNLYLKFVAKFLSIFQQIVLSRSNQSIVKLLIYEMHYKSNTKIRFSKELN